MFGANQPQNWPMPPPARSCNVHRPRSCGSHTQKCPLRTQNCRQLGEANHTKARHEQQLENPPTIRCCEQTLAYRTPECEDGESQNWKLRQTYVKFFYLSRETGVVVCCPARLLSRSCDLLLSRSRSHSEFFHPPFWILHC